MLDEIVNEVSAKTGLSQDQAKAAVESVIGFLKTRLPAPIAGELDNLLNGVASGNEDLASEATAVLGSFFHKNS